MMLETLPKVTTFAEHEECIGFLNIKISGLIDRLNLAYLIPNKVIAKPEKKILDISQTYW